VVTSGGEFRLTSHADRAGHESAAGPDCLLYKENWSEARERYRAFWQHEVVDRVCIGVSVPRENQTLLPESPDIVEQQVGLPLHIERLNVEFQNTYFGGEALPISGTHLGYAAFGGKPVFGRGASGPRITDWVWVEPVIEDWERTPWRFDPHAEWTARFLAVAEAEIKDSRGKYLPCLGAVLPPTDVLSLLRGAGPLCMDLIDHPAQVRRALKELLAAYTWLKDWFFDLTEADRDGSTVMGMWAPGTSCDLTCDFSCEISADHFRKFVVPEIHDLTSRYEHSFYHLDGANALHHLPALLEIGALDGIQFARGPREAERPTLEWLPLFKDIQAAGKLQQIGAAYDDVEPLVKELGPRGIFVSTGASSIEAAEALLLEAAKWGR